MVITPDFGPGNAVSITAGPTKIFHIFYMEFECKICGQKFKTLGKLKEHLTVKHNYKNEGYQGKIQTGYYRYLHEYENFEYPKCIYCGNIAKLTTRGFSKICNSTDCLHKYNIECGTNAWTLHPENIEKQRKNRLNYLKDKKNFNNTAWGKRINGNRSFLEQWFIDNVINKYNLQNKYIIVSEYCEFPYILDFAIIQKHIDIELDGRCHFNNGNKRIEHDIKRDNYLLNKGWKIFRISFKDVEYNSSKIIDDFLNFLNNETKINISDTYFEDLSNELIKYSEFKKRFQKVNSFKEKRNKHNKEILLDLEQNSNIDFTKFGWVKKCSDWVNNKYGHVTCNNTIRRFIKIYYPDFFEHNIVFTRK